MTRDETIALFERCEQARADALAAGKSRQEAHEAAKAIWNGWAEDMLAERKRLEEAGEWTAPDSILGSLEGPNDQTWDWFARAAADFTGSAFSVRGAGGKGTDGKVSRENEPAASAVTSILVEDEEIYFRGFIFPGSAEFGQAQFHGLAEFADAQFLGKAQFERAQFYGEVLFGQAQFHRNTQFEDAQFRGPVSFGQAQFHGLAEFADARYHGTAWFWQAQFHGWAEFGRAQFLGEAQFEEAQFHGEAGFEDAQFHAHANFASASFAAATNFRDAAFGTADKPADASFTGIKVERAFDMTGASFSKVPSFNQANFAQAPDLDDVTYPISDFWQRGVREDIARYRHLRRIALGGHNHEAEAMAFKGEVRAKRGTVDRWWQPAFWFGVLYDGFSNFGRSLARPFAVWLGMTLAAALALFALSPAAPGLAGLPAALINPPACYAPADNSSTDGPRIGGLSPELRAATNLRAEALHLAVHNASVILGAGESTHRSLGCLYGVELYNGGDPVAVVPSAVATLSAAHKLISAIFIFLFLLALRNMLKLK